MKRKLQLTAALVALPFLAGCPDDGAAENAGEKVDEAAEEAADAVEDAADDVEDAADGQG